MKQCSKCKIEKVLSEFPIRSDTGKHRGVCYDCKRAQDRDRHASGPKSIRAQNQALKKDGLKICGMCKKIKPLDEFHKSRAAKGSYCKPCLKEWTKTPAGKRATRDSQLRYHHGISLDDYERMLAAQGGVCANDGCGRSNAGREGDFIVDHDHQRGCHPDKGSCDTCRRDLLCHQCNVALGLLDDDQARLVGLVKYLDKHHLRS